MNPFELIKGTNNIAKFMGYTPEHLVRYIIPEMKKYNLVFKQSRKKTAPWITSAFFINVYYYLKSVEENKTNE